MLQGTDVAALVSSLRTQWAIIYAIVLRELHSKYSKSRLGFLLAIIDPVLSIAMLTAIRYFIRGQSTRHGMPILLFVSTGYLVWYAFRHTALEVAKATQQKHQMLMFPQVTVLDAILARTVIAWFTFTGVAIVISLGVVLISNTAPPHDVSLILFSLSAGLWLGASLGIVLGVALRYWPILDYAIAFIFRAGVFLSGAMFTAEEMPTWIRPYLSWNPIFHACELIRIAWLPSYASPIANPYYVVLCGVVLTGLALATERGTRHFKFS
jgi:capsular polysaccharide transport system permease protein